MTTRLRLHSRVGLLPWHCAGRSWACGVLFLTCPSFSRLLPPCAAQLVFPSLFQTRPSPEFSRETSFPVRTSHCSHVVQKLLGRWLLACSCCNCRSLKAQVAVKTLESQQLKQARTLTLGVTLWSISPGKAYNKIQEKVRSEASASYGFF